VNERTEIASMLAWARSAAGLSAAELGRLLDLAEQHVLEVEAGHLSLGLDVLYAWVDTCETRIYAAACQRHAFNATPQAIFA
jgi:transcriptional regulator with XRE-family HTH domain